ncbi:hypothetical protein OCU04_007223 [Sclerotinia nivalis]|uniref:Uncharacterized protein n=1 Tax=Sclerotinia nivalis TaxID=352851 RepID=A0A9X0ALD5_9HELO|nr:hypothetical protein OCU04_007223 [Sclerotinia nivalis]
MKTIHSISIILERELKVIQNFRNRGETPFMASQQIHDKGPLKSLSVERVASCSFEEKDGWVRLQIICEISRNMWRQLAVNIPSIKYHGVDCRLDCWEPRGGKSKQDASYH